MTALRLVSLFLCVLYLTEAAFSVSSSKCCTQLGERISKNVLNKVIDHKIQRRDGICDLQAFVFYTKERTFCMSTKSKRARAWIVKQKKKDVRRPNKLNGSQKKNRRRNRRRKIKKNKHN
ncbi:PREDICTED: C-C motif chemokine 28 [Nanorana parkeri]|uniref:C-C motif chemokine 28 n=1 Tax=Nanorana parkeri TaxID=125878 RepID=UPI000854CE87|nr:PREDICTED: C-C motif chemokine 28 [Nanorana parkeri]